MIKLSKTTRTASFLLVLFILCLLTSCVSHLHEAKYFLAEGQDYARSYDRSRAEAFFKRSRQEAEDEVKKHPSAQAYLVKSMAEMELKLWDEAEKSLKKAFLFGFEKGEEWAEDLALYGMAVTLQEMGLENVSDRVFANLVDRSKFKPVVLLSAQFYVETSLIKALQKDGKARSQALKSLLAKTEKLSQKNLSCGYYHYLTAQICGHLEDFQGGFESGILAKELSLPSVEISRDNDLLIIFCYKKLESRLSGNDREAFRVSFRRWVEKWGWKGSEAPDWKDT